MLNRRLLPILAVLVWVAVVVGVFVGVARESLLAAPLIAVPGYGTVGVILAARRPQNPIGWLLLATASGPAITLLTPLSPETQNGIAIAGLALVLVLFPTGAPPSRRWLVPMVLVVVSWLGASRLGTVSVGGGFEIGIGVVVAAASLLMCAAAPIVRTRRARGLERSQMRWLGSAAAGTGAAVVLAGVGLGVDAGLLVELGGGLAVLGFGFGLPGAILVAVLRYRLYDIDRIVSRTVTYAIVAAFVSAVYAIPVVLAPEILGSTNDVVTAGATLAAATAFNPVRRRVRRGVDRRFNRSAYDAGREVDEMAGRLRDEVDLAAVSQGLATTAARALQPGSVAVWLRQ